MPLRYIFLISIFIPYLSFAQDQVDSSSIERQVYPRQSVEEARSNYERMLNQDFKPIEVKNSTLPKNQRKTWKQIERFKHFWRPRLQGEGYLPNPIELFNQNIKNHDKYQSTKNDDNYSWQRVGPFAPVNEKEGVGRINVVRQHPKRVNEFWVGTAGGGAWRSKNAGVNWEMLPNTDFLTLGVSDIAFSESNPDVVYIATGDANGSGSGQFVKYTIGLMKSTDGGETWNPTYIQYEQSELNLISRVLVDPRDENVLIVTTDHGIFRSTDGAESFDHVVGNGNFRDIEFIRGRPDQIIVTSFNRSQGGGITFYSSEDNGVTWHGRQSIGGAVRAELATSPADPSKVWAIVADQGSNSYHSTWISEDYGINWAMMEEADGDNNYLGWKNGGDEKGQGWYDLAIAVDPKQPSKIVIGGVNLWESSNSGRSFNLKTHYNGGYSKPDIHADMHDLLYFKDGTGYLVANDAGLRRYIEITDEFTNLGAGLPITQFYKIGVSQSTTGLVTGGTQDNGTFLLDDSQWFKIGGGDGMETAIDPMDSDIRYRSIYYGQFDRTTNGGQNWTRIFSESIAERDYDFVEDGPWVTAFVIDEKSPNTLYLAMTEIWKSTKRGDRNSWERISNFGSGQFTDLAISSDSEVIYAARGGALLSSPNDGSDWQTRFVNSQEITDIAVDRSDNMKAVISISGFNPKNKVFLIDGDEYYNISGNLPNLPVNSVVFDPADMNRIYAGTDIGVYTTYGQTGVWVKFGSDLLNTVITELEVHANDRLLYAATYGSGLWTVPLLGECAPNQSLQIELDEKVEICPGDSVFVDIDYPTAVTWTDGFVGNQRYLYNEGRYAVVADIAYCADYSAPIELVHLETRSNTISAFDRTLCGVVDSVRLTATSGFSEYNWSNGLTGRTVYVSEPGDYYVVSPNTGGCLSHSDTITIEAFDIPEKPTITVLSINDTLATISTDTEGEKYLWSREGIQISNDGRSSIEVSISGEYTVVVSNPGGCASEESEPLPVTIKSVIWDSDTVEGIVYPNPATDEVRLQNLPQSGNISYTIYDNKGKIVNQGKTTVNAGEAFIGIQQLNLGAYHVLVDQDTKAIKFTFIKGE